MNRKRSAKGGTMKYYKQKISPKTEEQKQGYETPEALSSITMVRRVQQ